MVVVSMAFRAVRDNFAVTIDRVYQSLGNVSVALARPTAVAE